MLFLTLQISSCLDDCELNKYSWQKIQKQFLDDNERMEIEIDPQEQKEYLGNVDKKYKMSHQTIFAIYKKQ